jgi:hypothetical protein
MIHRGPGFLGGRMIRLLARTPFSRQQAVSLSQSSCVSRESLALYKSFNTLWLGVRVNLMIYDEPLK